ncbi:TPA: phytanoyl-CoA dioxygenase [Candidatus Poribacteria bacterium]|nr:phytanoyl-CoA dioxygenase [Candidatus Poribacteria bacterium]
MIDKENLFTDEQMKQFIANGYVIIKPDIPTSLHETISQKLDEVIAKEGNPGNNLLPRVPEIQEVFDHPVVRGAFTSVTGPNYIMHPHRHPHRNGPSSKGGGWHKDSYWGYGKVRNHRCWWAMAFYFPQDTPIEMGPTAVMPSTQYYLSRNNDASEIRFPACGEAGTMIIIHYDMWHQATANLTDKNRFMLKFEFARIQRPVEPTWNNQQEDWKSIEGSEPANDQTVMWEHLWNWISGRDTKKASNQASEDEISKWITALRIGTQPERLEATNQLGQLGEHGQEAIPALIDILGDPSEPVGLNAAYALGNIIGQESINPLVEALNHDSETVRRHAAYALTSVGSPATPELVDLLTHESEHVRAYVAYVLGEIGSSDSVLALSKLLDDDSVAVRRNVVESLGIMSDSFDISVPTLVRALEDSDKQIRFTSVLSLARIGPDAKDAIPALQSALKDEDRYVRGYAVEALKQIGSSKSKEILLDFLMTTRWCPSTTRESTF